MRLLVSYVKQGNRLRILGVYSETFSLERKVDFKPFKRNESLENVEKYFNISPIAFNDYFYTNVKTDMDEENFVAMFSDKLMLSISEFGDESTLPALSMGREDA